MVIDAHLKHVNCVNNMKGKKYTFALHMRCGGFKGFLTYANILKYHILGVYIAINYIYR